MVWLGKADWRERPLLIGAIGIYGWCEWVFLYWQYHSVLERALTEANFDRQKTLRRMADEDLLELGSGRGFTRQKRFRGGSRVYCVCIDNEALEALLERTATRAVSPSCEAEPC